MGLRSASFGPTSKPRDFLLLDHMKYNPQNTSMTLLLGIDPGSQVTGYGVIRSVRREFEYITCGCIRIGQLPLAERLKAIFNELQNVITQHVPDEVAIEQIFMHRNAQSALKLGQARGVAIAAAATKDLSVAEYSARQIKQAVVGYGAADKAQVQQMVKTLLRLNDIPPPDAADALAVALCHAQCRLYTGLLKA